MYNSIKDLVSVVIPIYNHATLLPFSIESILKQTYKKIELILVEDGSTDNTVEVIEKYRDEIGSDIFEKIIYHTRNRGLPNSLNAGFSVAHGEYYTWTSADNISSPTQIETLLSCLKANPLAGMVYSNYQLICSHGGPLYNSLVRRNMQHPNDSSIVVLPSVVTRENFYLSADSFLGGSFLYKAEVVDTIGEYDPAMYGAEDYDYFLRLGDKYKIIHCPEVLYKYRLHENSLSAKINVNEVIKRVRMKNHRFRMEKSNVYAS